jgi:ribosome-binding protein aMBF1 (putative translation factor)
MRSFRKELNKRLEDPEYRKGFEKEKKRLELAVKIAKAREQQGMSQGELAKKADTTQQQVSRLETGFNSNIETFLNVLSALDMDFEIIARKKAVR